MKDGIDSNEPPGMKGQRHGYSTSKRDRRLPVFVFPDELLFAGDDETSHKQVLTIYNPYDFSTKFQVLSNAPHKYAVVESQGTIQAHCCVDLVVRHRLASDGPYDVSDKFRIEIFLDNKPVGRKQVLSTLIKSKRASQGSDDHEKPADFRNMPAPIPYAQFPHRGRQAAQSGPSVLLVLTALICLLALLLPLEGDSPNWPPYLHITINQKLIAAFALGLVTMAILKS